MLHNMSKEIMVYMLPVGEKTAVVLRICNTEKITAYSFVTGQQRLCPSNSKGLAGNVFCRK